MSQEYYFREGCFITELLNRSDSPHLSIAQARVEPGVTTRLHTLRATEAYYILRGEGETMVGSQRRFVQAGEVVHIPPGTPQQITNTGVEDLVFLAICSPRFRPEDYREEE
jgi:mannose-6-phosphate isomerase-like protein (cupin superfamily)